MFVGGSGLPRMLLFFAAGEIGWSRVSLQVQPCWRPQKGNTKGGESFCHPLSRCHHFLPLPSLSPTTLCPSAAHHHHHAKSTCSFAQNQPSIWPARPVNQ
ncbi:hypothetical protein HDK64DRAFT_269865 [Phyllosticta capitalensis]